MKPLEHPLFSPELRQEAGWLNVDCIRCWTEHPDRSPFNRPFIVCPDCGNKRCPKASDHRNSCGDSNEAGQEGSFYRKVDGFSALTIPEPTK